MSINPTVLKDVSFKENNILLSLDHTESKTIDDMKHIYFNMIITYENSSIKREIMLFEDDILNLNISNFTNDSPDYFFIEPDFWLTVIQLNNNDLILYINFDSGLIHTNIATDSGFSIRMNITKDSFDLFIKNIKSII
ncbi:hypothetical protein ACUW9N_000954 [Staphylococcus auricularis]|uniref:Uncharacterized protein n=1 Tax=Staphylococcus auricularis TaxID=29379 RepID=A0AAP8TT53_9STAP|nr:hypothetical protein [Staphylococcus auricularis]MBM0868513.1 hypothetical protein [Staphylococcus auricularis]MCG7341742.1 hypothetical protein [Staphylococcus auricularis]MDC6327891.1 hypothetical protein [Staphylococcus auricularis]MDN4533916.1 hypothetical protein [Staphylococcus auricularis]PNZ67547.1 hypothetical protein CD158_05750 [Staphylococcus auricularis]